MTIVTTMCKLLFAMLIGFYLFKKDILTKEVNAKLSSLIVQITCPCIILNSLSTVSHDPEAVSGGSGDVCDLSDPVLDHHKDHACPGASAWDLHVHAYFFK